MSVVRALALCALLLAFSLTGAVGLAAGTATADATPTTGVSGPSLAVSPPDNETTNNTTVQHRDPDEVGENGDLGDVQNWLSGRMISSLRESGVQISQGEYEFARSLVGDEYDGLLGQYVDVAGETDSSSDDETADTLEDTKDTQREYAETVQEYEETYEEYREARESGSDARARELARELNSLAEEVRGQDRQLERNYRQLGNQTGEDFTELLEQFDAVTANVTEQAIAVQERELVATTLVVRAVEPTASFTRPLELTGELRVDGNESLPETATVLLAGETRTVDIGPDGTFALSYRPRTTPVGEQTFNVTYVPEPESLFVGSNASVSATIVAETPTIVVTDQSESVAFGEQVRVEGQVSVNGTSAGAAPVVLFVDGRRLASTRVAEDGSFVATGSLPASIQPGDVAVRVRAGEDGRAIAANATNTTVTVAESASSLDVTADASADEVRVSGTLEGTSGAVVPEQSIEIRVNGTFVSTARTNANGVFSTTLDAPADADTVRIRAAFDGTDTNLRNSTAETRVELQDAAGGSDSGSADGGPGSDPAGSGPIDAIGNAVSGENGNAVLAVAAGVGLLVVALGIIVFARRRSTAEPAGAADADADASSSADAEDPAMVSVADRLERMGEENTASLVRASYHTLRDAVAELGEVPDGATHWEFYRAVVEDRPEVEDDLRRVVEAYERVVYAEEPIDTDQAGTARDAAKRVVEAIQDVKPARASGDSKSPAD